MGMAIKASKPPAARPSQARKDKARACVRGVRSGWRTNALLRPRSVSKVTSAIKGMAKVTKP